MTTLTVVLLAALQGGLAAAEVVEKLSTHARPPTPPPGSNPLVSLASALVAATLYILQLVQSAVAFVTITIPTLIVQMLHASFTISLGFPHIAALFAGVVGAIFFVVRYRYLTRYTQLKEDALPPPSPPTLSNSLPLIGDEVLNDLSNSSANPLKSYLDDFLSAIRIFGYLEKPVFHELSRHLQTRRLAAGDTMEIGGGEFWCVVEGRVQVFAPTSDGGVPSSPDPFTHSSSSFNGYTLINEVSTGGTLSSLFSILSLFTEDIKLPWATPSEDVSGTSSPHTGGRASRADSDVSQLDGRTMGLSLSPVEVSPTDLEPSADPDASRLRRYSSVSTADGTARASSWSPEPENPSPKMFRDVSSSEPVTTQSSPSMDATPAPKSTLRPSNLSHHPTPPVTPNFVDDAMKGTIARATVDSTLAVIPAEAFRKLTRKYPKATGSIVQVVLERFSRVTFMAAHKFLGLTREILRSEAALNQLVSYPLPRSFYSGGGMQHLRERFQPELRRRRPESVSRRTMSKEFLDTVPPSPTVKAPSLPSVTPRSANTPAVKPIPLMIPKDDSTVASDSEDTAAEEMLSVSPLNHHHPSTLIHRNSQMRKEVAAGDLALTADETAPVNDTFYRSPNTPGLPRMDTWRGRLSSTDHLGFDSDEEDETELRDALVECIAKSVGLLQDAHHVDAHGRRSVSASVSLSTPNSPMLFPNGRPHTSNGRPPFGNVLDMMNASGAHNHNNIGGLLRESLLNAGVTDTDDQSSVSASMQDSFGGAPDVNAKILRDLGTHLEILHFKKGATLAKQGDRASGLYYVIDGFLDVSIPVRTAEDEDDNESSNLPAVDRSSHDRPFGLAMGHVPQKPGDSSSPDEEQLYTVKPGGLAGYLSSLCSQDSYVNIRAKTDCFVGFLPQHALDRITERRPLVQLTLAKRLLSLLSPQVLHIDAGLDWIQLGAGEILYEKGDKATDFYLVINGRLRAVSPKKDREGVDVHREYGQNDSIGELDVITGAVRPKTVQAIRQTELVRIPAALFDAISARHPATTLQFMRLIARRVRKAVGEQSVQHWSPSQELRADRNLKTVCIIGTNRSVPVAKFAGKLKTSLEEIGGATSYLDQATVMRHLGRHAFTRMGALKIAGWLADQEQHHRIVLYVADTPVASQWTMTCIRQADLVLVVGMGDDPSLGEYEKLLMAMKCYARKELILLHDERTVAPGSTRLWLKNRPWVQAHYHVELPGVVSTNQARKNHDPSAVAAFKHLREQVETKIKQYRGLRPLGRPRRPPHMDDFARIARRLCGKQVGLVLGGGGARGISHLGMLQALEEAGIPVDGISGCSIGSMIGGLYSRNTDIIQATGRAKQFAGRMGSMLRILSDVTYPFVAYTTGHEFNRGIYKAFYNTHIEDFWIPFFCNSTNITHSRMDIHRSGYAWRYVRASMTLAGFLPPLSDNGNLLVDGGYMDNTPIGPLRASGIRDIIVVDVGSIDDTSPRNYGDSVSGWWLFFQRFNPFFKGAVPSMTEISSRLTYVSSVKTLEDVKEDPYCRYMTMPVQQFETIGGFKKFTEVREIGLEAARKQLKMWAAEGRLPRGYVDDSKSVMATKRNTRIRRSSI